MLSKEFFFFIKFYIQLSFSVFIDGNVATYAKHAYYGMEISLSLTTIAESSIPYANTATKKVNDVQISFLKNPNSVTFSYIISINKNADIENLAEEYLTSYNSDILTKNENSNNIISLSFNSAQLFDNSQMIIIVLHGYYSDNVDYEYYIGLDF